jgi:hypothetical protein
MASQGSRFKRLSVDAELPKFWPTFESELSDFTAKCGKYPCTQENTLRTFIQRRITHKLERQEETAQTIFSRKWVKIAEMPAHGYTDIMKTPWHPRC